MLSANHAQAFRSFIFIFLLSLCLALISCFSYSPDTGLETSVGMLVDSFRETTKDYNLRHAVLFDCTPVKAREALTQGANPNFYRTGRQPLIVAAVGESGCEARIKREMIELLINNGANVNVRGYSQCTAFSAACRLHDGAIMKLLFTHGADINLSCSDDDNIKEIAHTLGFQGIAVYCLMDSKKTNSEISHETGISLYDVEKVIDHLSHAGNITLRQ